MIALRHRSNTDAAEPRFKKTPLDLKARDFMWPVLFMLSLSMIGLDFPLGLLFCPLVMFNRFRYDRYDFLLQLSIFLGGFSMITSANIYFSLIHLTFLLGLVAALTMKKAPILKKVLTLICVYTLGILFFVFKSDESFLVQLTGIESYLSIIYVFVPFMVFSGREFDIERFFRQLMIYAFIFCGFYILDSAVMGGMFFIPNDPSLATYGIESHFWAPYIKILSFEFPRRWPPGLFILMLTVYPITRIYKLNKWQWALIIGAMLVCRTFTFTIAFVVGYMLCRATARQVVFYCAAFVVAVFALYQLDSTLGEVTVEGADGIESKQSALRVKSSIDQLLFFDSADEETLASIGTGRGAQIIPKMELLFNLDREWIGFGFLSRTDTKSTKYIIDNELYVNPEFETEVATGVESVPFQIILDIGIIGLIFHVIVFAWLWLIVRRLPHQLFFLSTILLFAAIGFSGLHGLIRYDTLILTGLAWAAVVLSCKRTLPGFNLPPVRRRLKDPQKLPAT